KRYASLYFVVGIDAEENELIVLEIIHRFVELLDLHFGNVCELDIVYNYEKAYFLLDELLISGEIQESSKRAISKSISTQDEMQEREEIEFSPITTLIKQSI
ncbi:snare-like protein, partial [Rozella allomycis CSF55]